MSTAAPRPAVGAIVLTMNDRPAGEPRALASLLAQDGIDLDVVVVGNGVTPAHTPEDVRTVHLPENVGIPEGRNVGAAHVKGDLLFFFDNDAVLPAGDVLARLAADAQRPGTVTVMAEGVVMVRRSAFDLAGQWPGAFHLFHEGLDLAWRLWQHGYTGLYRPEIVVHHPATHPARHAQFYRLTARNRVWLARRTLPALLIPANLATWALLTVWRVRGRDAWHATLTGLKEGLHTHPGTRSPISWRTVARLTRAGRPPIF
ncbi:glycosyltransferase family 2 protein [Streptomyces sp. NPDC018045]|uniref:glycosyltransferase family 2 protein n=1 Tax=Streptomyces sp. NPDC018045 TaxID=3365037 RepID=UPI0037B2DDF8